MRNTAEQKKSLNPKYLKADEGKFRMSLLPMDVLADLIKVLEHGAKKYGTSSWRHMDEWNRFWDAAQRHLIAWQCGEDLDTDTGLNHMLHAACNCLFLATLQKHKLGTDNRQKSDDLEVVEPDLEITSDCPVTQELPDYDPHNFVVYNFPERT